MKFRLPDAAYELEPPPILGTWRAVYTAALVGRALRISLFYGFTRYFS